VKEFLLLSAPVATVIYFLVFQMRQGVRRVMDRDV
jgi:hypothetical protein